MPYLTPGQVVAVIAKHLEPLGYKNQKRVIVKGTDTHLSTKFIDPSQEPMTSEPCCELYMLDAYPDARGEVVLHVWNWIGMSGPVKKVAEDLTKAGLPARATKHRGTRVVKVKVSND